MGVMMQERQPPAGLRFSQRRCARSLGQEDQKQADDERKQRHTLDESGGHDHQAADASGCRAAPSIEELASQPIPIPAPMAAIPAPRPAARYARAAGSMMRYSLVRKGISYGSEASLKGSRPAPRRPCDPTRETAPRRPRPRRDGFRGRPHGQFPLPTRGRRDGALRRTCR